MTRDYCFSYGKNTQKNPHYWAIVTCFVQTGTLRLQSCATSGKLLTGEVYNTYIISGFSNVTIPDKTQKWEAILRTKTEKECVFQRQKLIEKNSFLYSINIVRFLWLWNLLLGEHHQTFTRSFQIKFKGSLQYGLVENLFSVTYLASTLTSTAYLEVPQLTNISLSLFKMFGMLPRWSSERINKI